MCEILKLAGCMFPSQPPEDGSAEEPAAQFPVLLQPSEVTLARLSANFGLHFSISMRKSSCFVCHLCNMVSHSPWGTSVCHCRVPRGCNAACVNAEHMQWAFQLPGNRGTPERTITKKFPIRKTSENQLQVKREMEKRIYLGKMILS